MKSDYTRYRSSARNAYDYYNLIEKSILEMEGESSRLSEDVVRENGMEREDL